MKGNGHLHPPLLNAEDQVYSEQKEQRHSNEHKEKDHHALFLHLCSLDSHGHVPIEKKVGVTVKEVELIVAKKTAGKQQQEEKGM